MAARSGSGRGFAGSFGGEPDDDPSGRLGGVIGQIGEFVGEVLVVIVDDPVALAGLPGHVDDQISPHRRPEHHPTTLGRMRFARLAVMGNYDRVMALELQPNYPGECRIDQSQAHPLAGLHRHGIGNAPVDRDRVADAARHAGFHGIAETAGDSALVVEPPILDEPQQITVDARDRLEFLDDQCAGQTASKLLQRVRVRVIPERAGIGRGELVDEALTGPDRLLCQAGHAVHRVRQANAVPVDGCVLAELVDHRDPHRVAPTNPQFRAGHGALIGPYSGVRVSVAGQVYCRRFRGELVPRSCGAGAAPAPARLHPRSI